MLMTINDLKEMEYFDAESLQNDLVTDGDLEVSLMDVITFVPKTIYEGTMHIKNSIDLQFDNVIVWMENNVKVGLIDNMVSPTEAGDKDKFNFHKDMVIPTTPNVEKDLTGVAKAVVNNITSMKTELLTTINEVDKEISRYLSVEGYTIGATVPKVVLTADKNLKKSTDTLKKHTVNNEVDTITIIDAFGNFKGSVEFYNTLKDASKKVSAKDVYLIKDKIDALNKRLDTLYEKVNSDDGISKTGIKVLVRMLSIVANYSTAFSVNYGLYLDLCEINHSYVKLLKDADDKGE